MSKKGSKAFLTEWLIGAFLIVVFLAGYLGDWSTFRPLRHMAADTLASLDHPSKDSDALVVVSIDDESLAKIGTWPWPRTLLAQLIEIVRKSGAKVIGVTFPLSDPDHSQGIEELRTIERRLRAQAEALSTVKELRDLRTKLSASTTAPPASKKPGFSQKPGF